MQVFKYIAVKGVYYDEWWLNVQRKIQQGFEPCPGQPSVKLYKFNFHILLQKEIQPKVEENIKKGFE